MLCFFFVVAEVFDEVVAVAPVFFYFYPELEVYFVLELLFDFVAGGASYFFQHDALFSNDDAFVGVFFADDGGFYVCYFSAGAGFHAFDGYG